MIVIRSKIILEISKKGEVCRGLENCTMQVFSKKSVKKWLIVGKSKLNSDLFEPNFDSNPSECSGKEGRGDNVMIFQRENLEKDLYVASRPREALVEMVEMKKPGLNIACVNNFLESSNNEDVQNEISETNCGKSIKIVLQRLDENVVKKNKTKLAIPKRKAQPTSWKRNVRKLNHLKGKQYVSVNGKIIAEKDVQPSPRQSSSSCLLSCFR